MHELHNNENEHGVSRLPEVSYVQQSSAILVPAHRAGFQGCSGHGCRVLHHVVQVFVRGGQSFHLRVSSTADTFNIKTTFLETYKVLAEGTEHNYKDHSCDGHSKQCNTTQQTCKPIVHDEGDHNVSRAANQNPISILSCFHLRQTPAVTLQMFTISHPSDVYNHF